MLENGGQGDEGHALLTLDEDGRGIHGEIGRVGDRARGRIKTRRSLQQLHVQPLVPEIALGLAA
jgi:hypothetical protein